MNDIQAKATKIKLLICDVDGVLSNGQLYLDDTDIAYKAFHVHDGLGLKLLLETGVEVGVITRCTSNIVKKRMEQLGIAHLYQGQVNKIAAYEDLLATVNCSDDQTAYIGDDLPDLPLIQRSGLGVAVANAIPIVLEEADWVTEKVGGHGAVREVCDLIMRAQNTMGALIDKYSKKDD